jgi:hypothetical protein
MDGGVPREKHNAQLRDLLGIDSRLPWIRSDMENEA